MGMAFGMGMIARAAVGGMAGGLMAPGQGFSMGGAAGGALAGLAGPAFGRSLTRRMNPAGGAMQFAAMRGGRSGSFVNNMVKQHGSFHSARKFANKRAGNVLGALSVYAGAQMGASAFRSNRGY